MLSVNEAIEQLEDLASTNVEIYGVLSLEFEGTCLIHIPKNEHRPDELRESAIGNCLMYGSSIWVEFRLKKRGGPREGVSSLDGQHIVARGRLKGPEARLGGCGHFSMWPAELMITNIKHYRGL